VRLGGELLDREGLERLVEERTRPLVPQPHGGLYGRLDAWAGRLGGALLA
jgi:hypothetical protein